MKIHNRFNDDQLLVTPNLITRPLSTVVLKYCFLLAIIASTTSFDNCKDTVVGHIFNVNANILEFSRKIQYFSSSDITSLRRRRLPPIFSRHPDPFSFPLLFSPQIAYARIPAIQPFDLKSSSSEFNSVICSSPSPLSLSLSPSLG